MSSICCRLHLKVVILHPWLLQCGSLLNNCPAKLGVVHGLHVKPRVDQDSERQIRRPLVSGGICASSVWCVVEKILHTAESVSIAHCNMHSEGSWL